jgi:hypothetical protein
MYPIDLSYTVGVTVCIYVAYMVHEKYCIYCKNICNMSASVV